MANQIAKIGAGAAGSALAAPSNTVAPSVTGAASQGQVLTCTTGTWTGSGPISYAYQWQNSGDNSSFSNIVGATANTYALQSGDVSKYVRCRVTATNGAGSGTANSNSAGPVAALVTPPSFRASATTSLTGLFGSQAVTMPTFSVGDVLVAIVDAASSSGTTATGWTLVDSRFANPTWSYVYAKQATGGDSLTVNNLVDGAIYAGVCSFSGGTLGASASQFNVGSSQIQAPTVTAATTSLLVNCYVKLTGGGTVTIPAGQTLAVTTPANASKMAYEQVSAGATGTRTATRNTTGNAYGTSIIISGN